MALLPAAFTRRLNARLASWRDIGQNDRAWIAAFEAFDTHGDKGPLLHLLKSTGLLRDFYLADLLERHQFKKKPGHQATPAYDTTDKELDLDLAKKAVREKVNNGSSVLKALEEESKARGIPLNALALAYKGSRGSTRRMAKRRPR